MIGCMQVQTGATELVLAGGAESMSQAEFYATGMRWGVKGAGVTLDDRLARGRVTAGGVNHPVPGGMIETAENLRRAVWDPARRAGRVRAALPPARGGRSGGRHVRAGDRAGAGQEPQGGEADRPRRAPARGHDAREARRPARDHGPHGPRRDRHRGQRQRSERRRRGVHRHAPREGRRARPEAVRAAGVLGGRGGGAGDDGHRPGALRPRRRWSEPG